VDGSEVKGKVLAKQDAPKGDAIPWLLLAAASHTGKGFSAADEHSADPYGGRAGAGGEHVRWFRERQRVAECVRSGLLFLRAGARKSGVAPPAILLEGPGLARLRLDGLDYRAKG